MITSFTGCSLINHPQAFPRSLIEFVKANIVPTFHRTTPPLSPCSQNNPRPANTSSMSISLTLPLALTLERRFTSCANSSVNSSVNSMPHTNCCFPTANHDGRDELPSNSQGKQPKELVELQTSLGFGELGREHYISTDFVMYQNKVMLTAEFYFTENNQTS